MEAIVLAGGLGTRLQAVISEIPKPMAPVGSVPFIHYLLKWLEQNGIKRTILSVGYKWEVIYRHFHEKYNSMELLYSVEDQPLGTGGAIALAMKKLKTNDFFIINGDTFFNLKLQNMVDFHRSGAFDFSMALKPMSNFSRYGTVEINAKNKIIQFNEKCPREKGLINGGIYLANQKIQAYFPPEEKFSFENDFLEKAITQLNVGGKTENEYFIDIGIPEDYNKAIKDLPEL